MIKKGDLLTAQALNGIADDAISMSGGHMSVLAYSGTVPVTVEAAYGSAVTVTEELRPATATTPFTKIFKIDAAAAGGISVSSDGDITNGDIITSYAASTILFDPFNAAASSTATSGVVAVRIHMNVKHGYVDADASGLNFDYDNFNVTNTTDQNGHTIANISLKTVGGSGLNGIQRVPLDTYVPSSSQGAVPYVVIAQTFTFSNGVLTSTATEDYGSPGKPMDGTFEPWTPL